MKRRDFIKDFGAFFFAASQLKGLEAMANSKASTNVNKKFEKQYKKVIRKTCKSETEINKRFIYGAQALNNLLQSTDEIVCKYKNIDEKIETETMNYIRDLMGYLGKSALSKEPVACYVPGENLDTKTTLKMMKKGRDILTMHIYFKYKPVYSALKKAGVASRLKKRAIAKMIF